MKIRSHHGCQETQNYLLAGEKEVTVTVMIDAYIYSYMVDPYSYIIASKQFEVVK